MRYSKIAGFFLPIKLIFGFNGYPYMMKIIELIGGIRWESAASYYQLINQGVKQQLGGLHAPKRVLVSVDFAEIEALQH